MNLCNHNECTGCLACVNICAHQAISIETDSLGFYYPKIQSESCAECGLCQKVCPVLHPVPKEAPKLIYSGWSKDEKIRMDSSSGGAFTEIATSILNQGGVVFGCMFDSHFKVIHSYIDNLADLYKLRRSKYVQSHIKDSYSQALRFLKAGKLVLFCGTPCQIAGLLSYLRRPYPNLYTIDLICHGVPSPQLWEEYKQYIEQKKKMTIQNILFRQKTISWIYFRLLIFGSDKNGNTKKYEGSYFKDRWLRLFLSDYFLRENCYNCTYCSTSRVADFTIADWWSYKRSNKADRNFMKKGVSLIFVNSEHGKQLDWTSRMFLRQRSLEESLKTNKSLKSAWNKPLDFETYRELYPNYSFEEISSRIIQALKVPFYRRVLDVVPNNRILSFVLRFTRIKKIIKRIMHPNR